MSHVGQTSEAPLALNIVRANECSLFDADGKEYLDLIAGIGVCNIGHSHPAVIQAVNEQMRKYSHIMVYGELIENPQVEYAKALTDHLPATLNSVFFTASGSEATEGAMKLAKRATGRTKIVSFKNSYHGSTQGALSVMGSEYWQQAFRPLLPGVTQLRYGVEEDLQIIDVQTACVIAETIQAEAGVNVPEIHWHKALRKRCDETGTLLILDEIQCGFGRNGTLWSFEQFDTRPDILLLGKALGGGMPLGAFVADRGLMNALTHDPVLGHINTFGGHPVSCAAGLAAFKVLLNEKLIEKVEGKRNLFLANLTNKKIKSANSRGLMMAVEFEDFTQNKRIIDNLIRRGIFTDWFLFAPQSLRICPPLTISEQQILQACRLLDEILSAE